MRQFHIHATGIYPQSVRWPDRMVLRGGILRFLDRPMTNAASNDIRD